MSLRSSALCALFTLVHAGTAAGGPPWISVELPANPHHASTRSASLLVRAYHHSTAIAVPVTGVAEGVVDGRRVSLPLDVRATHQTGVYAVQTPLPKGGTWVLVLTLAQSSEVTATALVTVDPQGRIVAIDVPSSETRDGWKVPRTVQPRDIEAALRTADATWGHAQPKGKAGAALLLPLLLVGGVAVSRARGEGRRPRV